MLYGYARVSTDHQSLAAQVERLKRARERGVRSEPKPKLTHHQQREALARRAAGESSAEIGRSYNVGHSTISRHRARG